jgi:sarcosine oxidase subunit gamma
MPRAETHCWLALTGACTPEMRAKACGVDMRAHKFPDDYVVQTSVARINAVVIRHDLGDAPAFHLLADSASSALLVAVPDRRHAGVRRRPRGTRSATRSIVG